MTMDSPSPTSMVVSARRTSITGISVPSILRASLPTRCDTSGRTVSEMRSLSITVGTKSSSTPYFL